MTFFDVFVQCCFCCISSLALDMRALVWSFRFSGVFCPNMRFNNLFWTGAFIVTIRTRIHAEAFFFVSSIITRIICNSMAVYIAEHFYKLFKQLINFNFIDYKSFQPRVLLLNIYIVKNTNIVKQMAI